MAKRIDDQTSVTVFLQHSAHAGRKLLAASVAGACLVGALSAPLAYAGPEDEPSGGEMMVDALVARPIGVATTAVGAAAFILTLPFSAMGGNIDKAADKLVIDPARETFVRCLGCRQSGHPDRFKGSEGEVK